MNSVSSRRGIIGREPSGKKKKESQPWTNAVTPEAVRCSYSFSLEISLLADVVHSTLHSEPTLNGTDSLCARASQIVTQ